MLGSRLTSNLALISILTVSALVSVLFSASDCNQTALVLQAIKDTNADLSVHLGIYVRSSSLSTRPPPLSLFFFETETDLRLLSLHRSMETIL